MGWNYRVLQRQYTSSDGEVEETFAIHEVYYRSDNVDDRTVTLQEVGYSDPVPPSAESLDALKVVLRRMLEACEKPILMSD